MGETPHKRNRVEEIVRQPRGVHAIVETHPPALAVVGGWSWWWWFVGVVVGGGGSGGGWSWWWWLVVVVVGGWWLVVAVVATVVTSTLAWVCKITCPLCGAAARLHNQGSRSRE